MVLGKLFQQFQAGASLQGEDKPAGSCDVAATTTPFPVRPVATGNTASYCCPE